MENRERLQLGTNKDKEIYKTLSDMREMMSSMKEERLKLQVMMAKAKTGKIKRKKPVTEESSSESESEEEKEPPRKLTKVERKALNQIRGGQGTSRKQGESSKNGGNGSGERQVDQGQQNQGQQTQPQGGRGRGRGRGNGGGRGNWQEYVCKYCDMKRHVIRFCQILVKDEKDHIVFTTIRGEVFDFEENLIDQDIEGGMRKEAFRRMDRPLPATFRQRDLVTLKKILAISLKLHEEFKQRMTRKKVITVKLSKIIPPEANWASPGAKMDWRCVATGLIKVQIGRGEFSALVDDGAAINIMREKHVIEVGVQINRNDFGFLIGVSGATPFCGMTSGVMVTVGKDLQKLNSVTVRDAGGLPNANQLSKSCAGRPIITLIDLYSGYDQFPQYTADRPMTAMHTPRGLLHMCAAPQGWTNVVAIVQRYMMRVMQLLCPDVTSPYIDDLAIPGPRVKNETEVLPGVRKFLWEHISNVEKLLSKLKEYNLTASEVKSRHGEESQLSIYSYNYLADATTRHWKTIWNTPCFHHVRSEFVIGEPFIEEDPWGERTSEQMMNLALSDEVELIKEPLTIEYGHEQADNTFRNTGDMSFLVNSLIHEDRLKMMNEEAEGSEIREAFREGEYDGEYKLMGMWLNGELREDEVDPVVRQKSKDFVVRYGHLFKKSNDDIPRRVVCGVTRQLDVIAASHDGVAGGHRSSRVTLKKIQHLYF
ncbi:hypothetical protein CBR_g49767 [Chara braunii]|uniref:Reverse transcriptase domain-containing protein n=1 Tax=Chara braunii TaxID=69332 RepID=A0A388M5Q6_CHABU|nr:hypothetical protein CBR_g49767 [Chara braunii]|eukprot:GBG89917.1 hypothetical protein CBR_g49767 [Chara braunii]